MAALWFASSALSVQTYKWVDADGKVHYSDQPPPQGSKDQGKLRTPRAATPAAAQPAESTPATAPGKQPKSVAEQEMEFRKRRLEAAEAEAKREKEAKEAQEKQRNCDQAKARLNMLQTGGRVTRTAPNGEQVYMEDAEIARELVEARKVADSWCKG
jgi:hypothetical protein